MLGRYHFFLRKKQKHLLTYAVPLKAFAVVFFFFFIVMVVCELDLTHLYGRARDDKVRPLPYGSTFKPVDSDFCG